MVSKGVVGSGLRCKMRRTYGIEDASGLGGSTQRAENSLLENQMENEIDMKWY